MYSAPYLVVFSAPYVRRYFFKCGFRFCQTLFHDDACEDASRPDAESPGREKPLVLGKGIYSALSDVPCRHPRLFKLDGADCGEVDMWFRPVSGEDAWVESGIEKSLDDFFSDFETVEGDTRPDDRPYVLWFAANALHGTDCFTDDALHGSAPSGVYGGSDAMLNVVEEYGYAVGSGDSDAESGEGGDNGIGIGENGLAELWENLVV